MVSMASSGGTSELISVEGVSTPPEILSATVNEREAATANPTAFALHQNVPNPFNPSTTISFSLTETGHATLGIYSINGQLVRRLVHGNMAAGTHEVVWDGRDAVGRDVASGVYVYRLHTATNTAVRKLTLVR